MKKPKTRNSVAFQGERGAFSFSAARKLLGFNIPVFPCESFKAVFQALESGAVTHAVIPIENSLHGSVHENYDHLLNFSVAITGETSLRIEHHLISRPGQSFRAIERAFSHPVALNQCRDFFDKYKRIAPVPFYDTAGSVKMLRDERPTAAAAIASEDAARIFGGEILKRNIEDNRQNFTRFFLLSTKPAKPKPGAGISKTSLVFSTSNTPGALFKAMACFALRDLNLTKIESRPLRARPWEYLFYVDVIGSQADDPVRKALDQLQEITSFFKVLGSYRPLP